MTRLLMSALLALCTAGSAFAQTATVTAADDKVVATGISPDEQKSADLFCLRQTGSHLRSITPRPHHERAVECANEPGRSYSREDIERTGAINTADALRKLDPSIH